MIKSDTKDLLQNMSNSNTLKQIILGKITVLKIDNNNMMKKCGHQISTSVLLLKDHVTLKTGVMAAENSALITGINLILKYI